MHSEDPDTVQYCLEWGQQPAARVPHLAYQASSNGTQKLQLLHINFLMIRKMYYWSWLVQKYGRS